MISFSVKAKLVTFSVKHEYSDSRRLTLLWDPDIGMNDEDADASDNNNDDELSAGTRAVWMF